MEFVNDIFLFLSQSHGGISFLDIVIFLIILFYVHEGYTLGFTLAFLDLLSFIISFITALKFYTVIASFLLTFFGVPIGIANAIGFFVLAFLSELVLTVLFRRGLRHIPHLPKGTWYTNLFNKTNHILGIIPGLISAFIILSFLLTIIVAFPSSPLIKDSVANSAIGSRFLANTSLFEQRLNDVFGGALNDTLSFMTVEPKSEETVELHFTVADGKPDPEAEKEMLKLVNIEREKQGLEPVEYNSALEDVARAHSKDMFARGYFSHYTPEGASPFDRMEEYGITYGYAGENLALAPTTSLAMQGLMNSPGHRANILSPNFTKLGIGVIDGGIYGKMYSQEFSD